MINVEKYNNATYNIIGAAMEVHSELGFGFLEQVYQKGMEEELTIRQIPYATQRPIKVFYKSREIAVYVPDLLIYEVVVELKSLEIVNYEQIQQQIINYLVATKKEVGLFINFGKEKLEYRRYIIPEKFQDK